MKAAAKGCDEGLTTVDFVCHGTPRPEVFAAYVEELEKRHGGKLTRYEFRNKDRGWNFHNIVYAFDNGKVVRKIAKLDLFYRSFFIGASLRSACFTCPYAGLERVTDLTIADCWRVATERPEYDDGRGTSLLLVNSERGQTFWNDCPKAEGGAYDLALAEKNNASLMQPAGRPRCYEEFAQIFKDSGSFTLAANIFESQRNELKWRCVYWVKRIGWPYFRRHQ